MAAIWKGVVRFADVEVPVKLFAAIEDRSIHFRLLHEDDKVPVQQQMVDPRSEEIVSREETRKAYELEDGTLVLFDADELQSLQPPPSRDIEILRFVEPASVPEQWYQRPYHVGPDGASGAYAAFVAALERTGLIGIARWVMRKKDYVGAFSARDHRLSLVTLRWSDEVIDAADLPRPAGRAPTKKELALAEQLVGALEEPLDMSRFDDEYRERVMELVAAKTRGETLAKPRAPTRLREQPTSLEDALRASLSGRRKGPKKAGETGRRKRGKVA